MHECENKVNDSSELLVGSCYVATYLLVGCVLTGGHKGAVSRVGPALDSLQECRPSPPHVLIGYRLLQSRAGHISESSKTNFQERLDSISICDGILYSSP